VGNLRTRRIGFGAGIVILASTSILLVSSRQSDVPLDAAFSMNFPERPAWTKCVSASDGWSHRIRWFVFANYYDILVANQSNCRELDTNTDMIVYKEYRYDNKISSVMKFNSMKCSEEFHVKLSKIRSAIDNNRFYKRKTIIFSQIYVSNTTCSNGGISISGIDGCRCSYSSEYRMAEDNKSRYVLQENR
jgi:hypothetical protein